MTDETTLTKAAQEALAIWLATGTAPEVGRMTAAGEPVTWEMIERVRPMVEPVLLAPASVPPAFDGSRMPGDC